jgi:hypothetical protein
MTKLLTLDQVQPDEFYDLIALAGVIKSHYSSVWREVRKGRLTARKVAGGLRVLGKDFLAYLEACKAQGERPHREEAQAPPTAGPAHHPPGRRPFARRMASAR